MNTPSSGLGNSQELYDLLEYLANCLNHTRECYLNDDEGRRLIPARVTPCHSWHCTMQGTWLESEELWPV